MEEILIHRAGKTIPMQSFSPVRSLKKAEWQQDLMGVDTVEFSLEASAPLQFYIGDYIVVNNRIYTLNFLPSVKKNNESDFVYNGKFEGPQYELNKKVYFNRDGTGFQTTADFPMTGEIETFLICLINNLSVLVGFKWVLGEYPKGTVAQTLSFSNENCLSSLNKICTAFSTEFEIVQDVPKRTNIINIKKVGGRIGFTFEYGRGKGLYSIERQNSDESNIVTRLYVYGSEGNIPTGYRNFTKRLQIEGEYIQDDNLVSEAGVIEGIKVYDDIKPTFNGIIGTAGTLANGLVSFACTNIDFDLNAHDAAGNSMYLIAGSTVKVSVRKGNLAGYEFEISNYNTDTKTFTVKQFKNDIDQLIPNDSAAFQFAPGDEFTLLGIAMPQKYIDNAEAALKTKGQADYDQLSKTKVKYALDIDPEFFRVKNVVPSVGDVVDVKDTQMGISLENRIISVTQNLLNEADFKVDVAETYENGGFVKQFLDAVADVKASVKTTVQNFNNDTMKRVATLENKTDFLNETNIEKNVIATGVMMVGDENGSNAGISGVTDNGEDSIRFFAGGSALEMNKAKWQVMDSGTMLMPNANGSKGWIWSNQNGTPILEYWHSSGFKMFELGERGFLAVAYVPESWTPTNLYRCVYAGDFDATAIIKELQNKITKTQNIRYLNDDPAQAYSNRQAPIGVGTGYYVTTTYALAPNLAAYEYYNGTHPDNAAYASLVGLKANGSSRTDNIPDGWYISNPGDISQFVDYNIIPPKHDVYVQVDYVKSGKITESKIITITK